MPPVAANDASICSADHPTKPGSNIITPRTLLNRLAMKRSSKQSNQKSGGLAVLLGDPSSSFLLSKDSLIDEDSENRLSSSNSLNSSMTMTSSSRFGLRRASGGSQKSAHAKGPQSPLEVPPSSNRWKRRVASSSNNNDKLYQPFKSPPEIEDIVCDRTLKDSDRDGGSGKIIHRQTAQGHSLPNDSGKVEDSSDRARYDISKGKSSARSKLKSSLKITTKDHYSSSRHSSPRDGSSFKIFLLLLNPKSKIFELIQLIFHPEGTSIGDILNMIPANATEPELGVQTYCGLCRPKDAEAITDLTLLVTTWRYDDHHGDSEPTAGIACGEILAAIPSQYKPKVVAKLSNQILKNPRIIRLLEDSDPLAPKQHKPHKSKRSRRSGRRSSREKPIDILDEQNEESQQDVIAVTSSEETIESPSSVRQAMEKAASAAAAANALVKTTPEGKNDKLVRASGRRNSYIYGRESPSLASDSGSYSTGSCTARSYDTRSLRSNGTYSEYSMDESYSTWSKSCDSSFAAGSFTASVANYSRQTQMTQRTQSRSFTPRQLRMAKRVGAAAFGLIVASYVWENPGSRAEEIMGSPMGISGLVHFTCVMVLLCKLQLLFGVTGFRTTSTCPFMNFMRSRAFATHPQRSPTGRLEDYLARKNRMASSQR